MISGTTGHERTTLTRDCMGIRIPDGIPTTLLAGSPVIITQQLGGSYTVSCEGGYLARIDSADADAIGKTAQPLPAADHRGAITKDVVYHQLESVYDPEIPVNIVELGLIYDCEIKEDAAGARIRIEMTLTAPGCGMGPVLQEDVRRKVTALPGVGSVQVDMIFDPPWDASMMSDVARLELGMM